MAKNKESEVEAPEFSAEEINAKVAAGLTKAQAIVVLQNQKEHDASQTKSKN